MTVATGPRQSGKTTLVRGQLSVIGGELRNLDEQGVLAAALEDPAGFVALGGRPLVIDEVQRGGEPLVRAIKAQVDGDTTSGQFVLTGSSNFLTVPTISESLAGRAGFVEVWPFTQGEMAGAADRFVDGSSPGQRRWPSTRRAGWGAASLLERVCTGGYPEVHELSGHQRRGWFRDYVRTTIERDVVELSGIRKVTEMGQLLHLLAARSGCELVMQSVIEDSALSAKRSMTIARGWRRSIWWPRCRHGRAISPGESNGVPRCSSPTPGLAAWLSGKSPSALEDPADPATGRLVETFVFAELRRQLTWAATEAELFHWQDRAGAEIDFVLEAADGRVAALEVKTGQTRSARVVPLAGAHARRAGGPLHGWCGPLRRPTRAPVRGPAAGRSHLCPVGEVNARTKLRREAVSARGRSRVSATASRAVAQNVPGYEKCNQECN